MQRDKEPDHMFKGTGRAYTPIAEMPIEMHICFRIKLARQLKNRSRPWLAKRIGVSMSQLRNIEQALHRCPAGRLYQIASALRMPISFFYEEASTVLTDGLTPSEIRNLNQVDKEMLYTGRLLMDLKDPLLRKAIRRFIKNVTPYRRRRKIPYQEGA